MHGDWLILNQRIRWLFWVNEYFICNGIAIVYI